MVAKMTKRDKHYGLPIALQYSTSSFPKRSNQSFIQSLDPAAN